MAQRIRHLTTNQGIAGSNPARVIEYNFDTNEKFVRMIEGLKSILPAGFEPATLCVWSIRDNNNTMEHTSILKNSIYLLNIM